MTQTAQRNETYNRAMDRLRDMIAATNSPLEKDIGELITEAMPRLGDAEGLLNVKKDLKGAASALMDHARRKSQQSRESGVYVGPGEALPVLLKYFDLKETAEEAAPEPADPFDLDALLGGL